MWRHPETQSPGSIGALLLPLGIRALVGIGAMQFQPPSPVESLEAVGSTRDLPRDLRRALDPQGDFKPVPVPEPGDWLAEHRERGQTFNDFVRGRRNRPDRRRHMIYLQPLERFSPDQSPPLELLQDFASIYFAMEVKLGSPVDIRRSNLTTRLHPATRKRQIRTGDVLAVLRSELPPDAFCTLAITMEDLYPDPSWNFVFGQASFLERIGVFSFARYDPAFYGERRGEDYQDVLLRRSLKVLAHETAHMFSLDHCIFFQCIMNGSNHLGESDSRPFALCPVCLRKLQSSIGFDVVARYRGLGSFYRKRGLHFEAQWVEDRLRWILAEDEPREHS